MEYTDAFDSTKMNVEFQEKKNTVRFTIELARFRAINPATSYTSYNEPGMVDLNIFELIKLRDELTDIIESYGLD